MANKEWVAVSFSPHQALDVDTMEQMNSNIIWLKNHAIDGKYMHLNNGVTDIGLKILCGRKQITPRKSDTAIVRIGFAKMFTPDSIPVITYSLVTPGAVKFWHGMNGIDRLHPDHRGFEVKVNVAADKKKNDKFAKSVFINWIAVGY